MSCRRAAAAFAVAASMLVLAPSRAVGQGTWRWPVGSEVSLAYGAMYTGADGKSCTHGGIDIPADAGATVRSCVAGHVTFAGPVPSGEGARSLAVTLLTADGLKVTLLPLAKASVKTGEDVASADAVGTLAGTGDASTAGAHLHLSVRRGDTHIDPAAFLAASVAVEPVDTGGDGAGSKPQAPDPEAPAVPDAPTVVEAPAPRAARSAQEARVESPSHQLPSTSPAASLGGATTSAMRRAVTSGSLAMGAVPKLAPLSRPAIPPLVRFGDALSVMAGARTGAAWWIVRLMVAGAAIACVRPLLRSVRPTAAPAPQRARA